MSIAIIGHYAKNHDINDGQTVKTRNLYNQLIKMYGKDKLFLVDTYNWKKRPLNLLKKCVKAIRINDNIIILPAHNGVKIFVPLFVFLNKFYHKNLIYSVIGGWLAELLENNRKLLSTLQKFNYILVETNKLKNDLNNLGLNNVKIMLNFKNINILSKEDMSFSYKDTYKLCTFSRVMKEKGISDAINAVANINKKNKKIIYQLDIYGPIDSNYEEELNELIANNKEFIFYKGMVDSKKSVETLKKYDLLLFPTRFKTEGLPGTIIDAFSSGLPTIYSSWNSCDEFFIDNYNGLKFKIGDTKELINVLEKIYNKKYDIKQIKENCLESAAKYKPDVAIQNLIDCLK